MRVFVAADVLGNRCAPISLPPRPAPLKLPEKGIGKILQDELKIHPFVSLRSMKFLLEIPIIN